MEREKIMTYLEGDILQNAPLLAALTRGTGELVAGGGESALLYEASGVYMLSAASREAAEKVLEALPACTALVACQADLADIPAAKYGLEVGESCHQAVYTGGPLPLDDVLAFRAPNETELDLIDATYDLDDRAGLAKLRDQGMLFAGFAGEDFVGYVGRHREGSVGLLNVFPQYRRRGYGQRLETFILNRVVAAGERPYCQIFQGNHASLALQAKLGWVLAAKPICWLFPPEG